MTKKELKQYRTICARLEKIREKLDRNIEVVNVVVQGCRSPSNAVHNVKTTEEYSKGASPSLLVEYVEKTKRKKVVDVWFDCIEKDINLNESIKLAIKYYYLSPIDDSFPSFPNVPSWNDVAEMLNNGKSGEALRKSVNRFIQENL